MLNNNCPLCKASKEFKYLEAHIDNNKEYKLYECKVCRAQFWWPLKNPGAQWYENDERYSDRNFDPILIPNWNHKKIISFLKNKTGKVLDIGCGVGTFLKHAQDNNWDTYGLDFDNDAIKAAQETFKLKNLEVCDLLTYHNKYPDKKFDLITIFDVFEHIDNHNEFIKTIFDMLSPGGYIAMSMPYRYGATWLKPHDLPPRHLTRWDRRSLTQYLVKQNFKVKYKKILDTGYNFILMKLRFRYGKFFSFNLVGKIKQSKRSDNKIELNSSSEKMITKVHILARIKDLIIFGLPALLIWLAMLPFKKRYVTLYVIAQKNE
ncbi:MAG: class I SAM-dependent methyltransferase [Candidatus Komeilibacteria bacterium]|jgi:2-polyprenyl-3-methyl-5-hydroxy-6-metoxy-1,4-benzoquinol methylase|nr:class I SAM-dependent methyltransferase [Candidatus Komeilibacteria bacterium]MBT4448030.1 class I SAM-dependent methyltransferase [Candidatus Komeilibacteria bacterium]